MNRILQWGTRAIGLQKLLQCISKTKTFSATRKSMMITVLAGLVYHICQKQWQIRVIVNRVQNDMQQKETNRGAAERNKGSG
ncbi:hypothetical protein CsatB_015864 [Cannabis sativa]